MENKNTPQLENGYIRIAQDIAKQLAKTYLSSYESQVIWALFIKTYGYHKKEDWISNSQFVEITGIHKSHVSRTIKKLIKRKIVTQTGNKIAFQKNSRLWIKLPKQVIVTQTGNKVAYLGQKVTQMGQKLPKQADTKDNIQKIITKDNNTNVLLAKFQKINPSFKRLFSNLTQRQALERLVKEYSEDWISKLLDNLPDIISKPYAPRITTPYELESKLGQLKIFILQEKNKGYKFSYGEI